MKRIQQSEFDRIFPKEREQPFLLYDLDLREEPGAKYSDYSALQRRLDLIIVKLGSRVVKQSKANNTKLNLLNLKIQLARVALSGGYWPVVVTSGARAFSNGGTLAEGQKRLMKAWEEGPELYKPKELLFDTRTIDNSALAEEFAGNVMEAINEGKVPFINASPDSFEKFPLDNSMAASYLASALVKLDIAPLVVMLGQYPGLYSRQGYKGQNSKRNVIRVVLNPEGIEAHLSDETSAKGTGGMKATVQAATQLQLAGVETVITNGMAYERDRFVDMHRPLDAILQERYVGTRFMPKQMWGQSLCIVAMGTQDL